VPTMPSAKQHIDNRERNQSIERPPSVPTT
jgi:hypothetical protein